ncbi:LysE family translocator [Nesterenkonia ebinurensis]|uniref:LysE family translocator n=1 Tax=Nesterenkonia ebinurensis TaxID=2608252 RepID=UPI00168B1B8B|nr:LysE family translocator [Nesterenkonia ebinurensis]
MEWSLYLSFVAIAVAVALTPGSDTAVVLKNSLMGGRRGGLATAMGVFLAGSTQAVLAAVGLGIIVAQSQTALQVIRWVGAAYLAWLAFQSLRSAWKGQYARPALPSAAVRRRGFLQGYLTNLTNPQVLMFFLALFPQFMTPGMSFWALALLTMTLPVLGTVPLLIIATLVDRAATWWQRRSVRRVLDAATGAVLGFLSIRVAADAFREAA